MEGRVTQAEVEVVEMESELSVVPGAGLPLLTGAARPWLLLPVSAPAHVSVHMCVSVSLCIALGPCLRVHLCSLGVWGPSCDSV